MYFVRWDFEFRKILYGGWVDGASNACGYDYFGWDRPSLLGYRGL